MNNLITYGEQYFEQKGLLEGINEYGESVKVFPNFRTISIVEMENIEGVSIATCDSLGYFDWGILSDLPGFNESDMTVHITDISGCREVIDYIYNLPSAGGILYSSMDEYRNRYNPDWVE